MVSGDAALVVDPALITERVAALRERLVAATIAAGRQPADVQLCLPTKTQPVELIIAALRADAQWRTDNPQHQLAPALIAENRVQELVAKGPTLTELPAELRPELHFIGPLQTNKINHALRWAAAVQTVDSERLAGALASRVPGAEPLPVWIQVNVSGEDTKSGVAPADAAALVKAVTDLPTLRLAGFMTIGANSPDPAEVTPGFELLRTLRDDAATRFPNLELGLSMGMSHDLELAVTAGSTLVRAGSAVFGPRTP